MAATASEQEIKDQQAENNGERSDKIADAPAPGPDEVNFAEFGDDGLDDFGRTPEEQRLTPAVPDGVKDELAGKQGPGEEDQSDPKAWDQSVLDMAGMSQEQAAQQFKSDDELRSAMAWQDKQAMLMVQQQELANQSAAQQAAQQQLAQQPPPQQQEAGSWAQPRTQYVPQQSQPPQQQQQQAPQPTQQDEFDPDKLNPEEWGEDTVKVLKSMKRHFDTQLDASNQRVEQMQNTMHQQHLERQQDDRQRVFDHFDDAVNGLPEQFTGSFGRGDRSSLQGSTQMANRVKLFRSMDQIRSGRQQMNLPALPEGSLMDRAIQAEFANVSQQALVNQTAQKLNQRFQQVTTPPSGRLATPLTPEEKAGRRVAEMFEKKCVPLAATEELADGV